ncbi:hypothetical protein GFB56_12275 [Ensifer sp. T173]|uniref:Ribbon-helix-helix protein CopG domain-containing protein n=1 Tax=Ensifer canadensis TaxID=555315 RepID=A0AAW4FHK3_9HYPH|nr:hypothetical protein [Ensifer canadensis]MBM3091592.1 hypothetical protein [Ensifer canadensis]UBI74423.1 hypothetical protein J3R84_13080 [Ensifer canadensis]
MAEVNKGQRVPLLMEPELIYKVDSFRHEHRIPTRAEAIRRLVKESLSAISELKPPVRNEQ